MSLTGKIDISLKFSELPNKVVEISPKTKQFFLNADNVEVSVTLDSKLFQRLEHAHKSFPSWVALLEGKMGQATEKGFILDEPKLQVFEKKPKAENS